MARWDKLWRDDAYVARNWIEPDPDIVRLSPIMQARGVQRVLDLGCGPGRHVLFLSRQGFEMHGLDISAAGVERCRKVLEQQHVMAMVGVPAKPLQVHAFSLLLKRRTLAGSIIGGIRETQEMLDYCAKKNITSDVEVIPIQQVETAWERTIKGDVRYRFVIDMKTL